MEYCKNCNHRIPTGDRYCGHCGAKQINQRFNLKFFIDETREAVFNIDNNRPLRTFTHMITKPHVVCQDYLDGVRKRYINPFAYITIALSIFGVFIFFFSDRFIEAINSIGTPIEANDVQAELQSKINKFVLQYQSVVAFINIPIYALVFFLVFIRKKRHNYLEHIVIVIYTQAQASIISSLLYLIGIFSSDLFPIVIGIVGSLTFLYFFYTYFRLYALNWKQIIINTLLIVVSFVFVLLMVGIVLNIILFATGVVDFQEFIEAEKAKRGVSYIASSFMNWTS